MTGQDTYDFSGTGIVVTGGTSGIGLAIAEAFTAAGAGVLVTGTRANPGDYDVDLANFHYVQLDVADRGSIEHFMTQLSYVDVLVNNAGASFPQGTDEWDADGFELSVRTNLMGAFHMSTALKDMLTRSRVDGGGSIINLASMASFFGVTMVPGYGASKAGIVQMTKTLAVQWASDHIRVNAIAPGLIDTRMTAPMKDFDEIAKPHIDRTPMDRWGLPDEIAPAALFLASSGARFITGATLNVDGGYSAS